MGSRGQETRSDPDLVAAALGGDKVAFGVLVGRHREMVEALVTRLMGASAARAINDGISRGRLRVPIGEQLPLEGSTRAHGLMEEGTRGRIVVLP